MKKTYRVGCKRIDDDGHGIVTFNNKEFAVLGILPKEKGEIELIYRTKETGARIVSLDQRTLSENRQKNCCPMALRCGGCQLAHMKYEAQIAWKQEKMCRLFKEEAQNGLLLPILPMEQPRHYRHKVYATFSRGEKGELIAGTYEENSHRVVNIQSCDIQNELANSIIRTILRLMQSTKTPPYDEDKKRGVLRHTYIRVGAYSGEAMVVLVTGINEFREKKRFVEGLTKLHPEIKTIIHNVNDKRTNLILGNKNVVLYGSGSIEDSLCGYTFRISPQSFYQVNPVQTELLYKTAVQLAELTGTELVLDAYCGIGTLSLIAAECAKEVVGVELNKAAVRDAKENAIYNRVKNVSFIASDAGEYMLRLVKEKRNNRIDVVFMDPPRNGSNVNFLKALLTLQPKKIVYISCNPVTQKRDLEILKNGGYQVRQVQPVDCFPSTGHVETVVLMSKVK